MKHSYRIKFTPAQFIIIAALAIFLIAGLVLSIINIASWLPSERENYWLDIVSLIALLIILTLLILLVVNSRYILDDARLRLVFGFLGFSVPVKDMVMLRTNEERSLHILYYNVYIKKTGETKTTFITLATKHATELAEDITKRNQNVIFDIFTTSNDIPTNE